MAQHVAERDPYKSAETPTNQQRETHTNLAMPRS